MSIPLYPPFSMEGTFIITRPCISSGWHCQLVPSIMNALGSSGPWAGWSLPYSTDHKQVSIWTSLYFHATYTHAYEIGTIGWRSLINLIQIVLNFTKGESKTKDTGSLAEEEREEMAFTVRTIKWLMDGHDSQGCEEGGWRPSGILFGWWWTHQNCCHAGGGKNVVFLGMGSIL